MNCKQCQQRVLDALAAGASHLAPEVTAHRNYCSTCTEFFMRQQNLFQSIDAGLQSVANQPVPPSLLPMVRARIASVDHLNFGFPAWASSTALIVLAFLLSAPFLLRTSRTSVARITLRSPQPQLAPVPPQSGTVAPNILPISRKNHADGGEHNRAPQMASRLERLQGQSHENEKQALAVLVGVVQRHPDLGDALLHPVELPTSNSAVSMIEIARLEVTPIMDESW